MMQIIGKAATYFLLLFLISFHSDAQILHPVKWSFSVEQKEGEATLLLKATIEKQLKATTKNKLLLYQ